MKKITIYTDGACRGNPGVGGWGAVLIYNGKEKHLCGHQTHATNNQMELLAAIEGIKAVKENCEIDLYTDSNYVRQGMMEWLSRWKKQNWKTANKRPVKNIEYWQSLEEQVEN